MAIETIAYDSTVWSNCNSLFSCNLDDIVTKPINGDNEWDVHSLKEFWDTFENDFTNNEPQSVVMNTKVIAQTDIPKSEHSLDSEYLNTSAFLSPISLSPPSPEELLDEHFEPQLNLNDINDNQIIDQMVVNDETALDILNNILSFNSDCSTNDSYEDMNSAALNAVNYFSGNAIIEDNKDITDGEILKLLDNNNNTTKKRGRYQSKRKSTDSDTSSDYRPAKRTKKGGVGSDIRKERKKSQNKSAANRYRMKKRVEQESVDQEMKVQEKINEELKQTLEKIQMEFKVVHPLAEAAFAGDPKRKLLLQMLHLRVLKDNLLD